MDLNFQVPNEEEAEESSNESEADPKTFSDASYVQSPATDVWALLYTFYLFWLILGSDLGPFVTPFLTLILNEYPFFLPLCCVVGCCCSPSPLFFFNFFYYDLSCEISRVVNRWALIELCGPWWAVLLSSELRGS